MVKVRLGEIHIIEVGIDTPPAVLKRLARRYAMTGGYELSLRADLEEKQLIELVQLYLPELESYAKQDLRYKSNNAYRVLKLLKESQNLPGEWRDLLEARVFSV